ncbi:MAG: transporter permease [Acidobacteria bacterium]|nr:transporter permease [Acidobacteriota bacterium]
MNAEASALSAMSPVLAVGFHAFDAQHLITLGVIAALSISVFGAARNGTSFQAKWLRLTLGFILLGYAACLYLQQGIQRNLTWQYSLPLELCNFVMIACIVSLFRPSRILTEIAYFWGCGGVLQATLTPDLGRGFPSWDFILFFWGHGATLLGIIFLISSRGFRPRKGSIMRMMVALNLYAIVVGLLDAAMGWNYGYLCQKPATPSLLDFLGPWPWYLLSLEVIALLTFLLLNLPWLLRSLSVLSGSDPENS